jgi:hypothetical protein
VTLNVVERIFGPSEFRIRTNSPPAAVRKHWISTQFDQISPKIDPTIFQLFPTTDFCRIQTNFKTEMTLISWMSSELLDYFLKLFLRCSFAVDRIETFYPLQMWLMTILLNNSHRTDRRLIYWSHNQVIWWREK